MQNENLLYPDLIFQNFWVHLLTDFTTFQQYHSWKVLINSSMKSLTHGWNLPSPNRLTFESDILKNISWPIYCGLGMPYVDMGLG